MSSLLVESTRSGIAESVHRVCVSVTGSLRVAGELRFH